MLAITARKMNKSWQGNSPLFSATVLSILVFGYTTKLHIVWVLSQWCHHWVLSRPRELKGLFGIEDLNLGARSHWQKKSGNMSSRGSNPRPSTSSIAFKSSMTYPWVSQIFLVIDKRKRWCSINFPLVI